MRSCQTPFCCRAPVDIVSCQICVTDLGLTLGDLVDVTRPRARVMESSWGCCCDCSEKYFGEAVNFEVESRLELPS